MTDVKWFGSIDKAFNLTPGQEARLSAECLVGLRLSGWSHEFVDAYENLRDAGLPVLVTSDSVLHAYHVAFDKILQDLESGYFIADLTELSRQMMNASVSQAAVLDPTLASLATKNAAFFAVGLLLLEPNETLPGQVREKALAEVTLVLAHGGFSQSPVFGILEDYSQYIPRGHYTVNTSMERYFRAAMWFGRMTFVVSNDDGLRGAALVGAVWSEAPAEVRARWDRIYDLTSFFVGPSDDLLPRDLEDAVRTAVGNLSENGSELLESSTLTALRAYIATLPDPAINSGFVTDQEDRVEATKGLRLLGQRAIPDSVAFQKLVYDEVGPYLGSGAPLTMVEAEGLKVRGFPRGLDVMAAMGSEAAAGIVKAEGDADYAGFDAQTVKARGLFDNITTEGWNRTLYLGWLNALRAVIEPSNGTALPQFMRTQAFEAKSLNTALGSWTELRRDTILYAKQSYTIIITSAPQLPDPPPATYVEPAEALYARLATLSERTRTGLERTGALTPGWNVTLGAMVSLMDGLRGVAENELAGQPLTDDQAQLVRWFPERLEAVMGSAREKDRDTRLVADVHSDPNSMRVLEEAVGDLSLLVVLIEGADGKWYAAAGPIFTYYEFTQPLTDRLSDEAWRTMLLAGAPSPAPWQGQFFA